VSALSKLKADPGCVSIFQSYKTKFMFDSKTKEYCGIVSNPPARPFALYVNRLAKDALTASTSGQSFNPQIQTDSAVCATASQCHINFAAEAVAPYLNSAVKAQLDTAFAKVGAACGVQSSDLTPSSCPSGQVLAA
jgi:hypothetical protein